MYVSSGDIGINKKNLNWCKRLLLISISPEDTYICWNSSIEPIWFIYQIYFVVGSDKIMQSE